MVVPDRNALVKLFSYYRDAETRGAGLLMKMMARVDDPEAQVLFSRHINDETRHAWMWTKRIKEEGALPVPVPDGYQRRLGKALGIPRSIIDLFALTVVVEERSQSRYSQHAASPACDEKTLDILRELTQDEKWHISWMEEWLYKLAAGQGIEARARDTLAEFRSVEAGVFAEMKEMEREWLGFSFSDVSEPASAQS